MITFPLQAAMPEPSSSIGMILAVVLLLGLIIGLSFLVGDIANKRIIRSNPSSVIRPSFVSGILILSIVLNVLISVSVFFTGGINWTTIISAASSILAIVALVCLLQWKKLGFYVLCFVATVSFIVTYINGGLSSAIPIIAVPVFWYLILLIKCNDGKSVWKHLK